MFPEPALSWFYAVADFQLVVARLWQLRRSAKQLFVVQVATVPCLVALTAVHVWHGAAGFGGVLRLLCGRVCDAYARYLFPAVG